MRKTKTNIIEGSEELETIWLRPMCDYQIGTNFFRSYNIKLLFMYKLWEADECDAKSDVVTKFEY